MRRLLLAPAAGLVLLAAAPAGADPPAAERLPPSRERVRGVTISTHTDGRDWATDAILPTLDQLRELGAEWVAIHPYARVGADGTVRFRESAGKPPEHVIRPIREAHARGLKILIKPHLAYWGSPFRWRGEIEFVSEEEWGRFWSSYEAWILGLAEAAREADGFVVGTELDRTLHFEEHWRRLVAGVRKRTGAPLTYAANWTDYERVGFWDALDVIGIQAYFPLSEDPAAPAEVLREGWRRRMDELRRYARARNRSIVFTELGYNRSYDAPVRPWEYRTDGEEAEAVQRLCLREALRAVDEEPWVAGVFLWKWFPEPWPVGRTFQLATPSMRRVIREAWRGASGS